MSSAGLIETTTEIRGGKIAWSSLGAGPLAVVAHGLTQSRRATVRSRLFDWTPIASAGRRLVEYDARGHGLSGGPKNPVAYTWPELATDLLDLIQELAGDQPVAGVGSSMGTATLLHAVTRSPGRFDRLVLTAPPTAWATRAAQAGMYSAGADLIEARGMQAFRDLSAQAPVPPVFSDLDAFPPAPDVSEALLPSVLRGAGASDLPAERVLAGLHLPVLILAWAGDPGHPIATAEKLAGLIQGSELRVAETGAQLAQWGRLSAEFLRV